MASGNNGLVQASIRAVAAGQGAYIQWQTLTVPLLLLNWLLHAHTSDPFQFLTAPLVVLAVPLLELAFILFTVGLLLGFAFLLYAGHRTEFWSSLPNMLTRMGEHVFIGATSGCTLHASCHPARKVAGA